MKALADVLPDCLSPLRLPRSSLWEAVMAGVEWSVSETAEEWLSGTTCAAEEMEQWLVRGRRELFR